jgi:hypothetical protein
MAVASAARGWAQPVASALRKAKGRAVRVRMSASAPGRLVVRVLDARDRTLARAGLTFGKAGKKTLTIPRAKRGTAVLVSLLWAPKDGAAEIVRKRL